MPRPVRKITPLKKYVLVLHRNGYSRTLTTPFAYVDRAVRNGCHRLLRGGDWFQVIAIANGHEVAKGGRDGHKFTVRYAASAQEFATQTMPIRWLKEDDINGKR